MELALQHPTHGYYRTQQAVGRDFTTAPEISQLFGELIGAWAIDIYEKLGNPPQINLIELGPGRGTLMADLLRVAPLSPPFLQALQIHLVEINPLLKQSQQKTIDHPTLHWHETINTLPTQAPLIILANEFFDALPTNYYIRKENILYERQVDLAKEEFVLHPLGPDEGEDTAWEESPATLMIFETLGQRLHTQEGALLLIDYGYETGQGDTLQALYQGAPSSPLSHVGQSDVTSHVNFGALKKAALDQGLTVFGPVPQGSFLKNLGIDVRTALLKHKNPQMSASLTAACERLTHPHQMGTLFKVMAIASSNALPLEGFE